MHVVLLKSQAAQHGGLEKHASRIAQEFLNRHLQVSILTTDSAHTPSYHPGISVHSVKTCRWPAFRRMEQFDRFVQNYLQKHPSKIVFGMDRNRFQTHYRAGNGVHAAFLKSRSLIENRFKQLSFLLNPLHLKILELEKAAFENPWLQKLFTNSHMVRKEIQEYYCTDKAKIEVIHNGVEWHEMENDFKSWPEQKGKITQKYGLDAKVFHFLFIGNGYLRKGLRQLLSAMALLKEREFHLSIIGKDNDLRDYQELVSQYRLQRHVAFFGPQKEIRPFYQMADALVIPSFYDPFANVTVEALAMGLFVVSSKFNGGHEILTFQNGAVIDDLLDPGSLAESLSIAIRHHKTPDCSNMIRQSVRHLDFSHQLKRLIDSCLGSSSSNDKAAH
jgi:UDP-glucose:(heptosyl)LPS alpha-1,3-glucosyltransferase